MTVPILTPITLPKLAAAPSSPNEGDEYYDTTLHQVGYWNGVSWVYGSSSSVQLTPYFLADGTTFTVPTNTDAQSSMFKFYDGFWTIDGFLTDVL
jgi:hypothetical protein